VIGRLVEQRVLAARRMRVVVRPRLLKGVRRHAERALEVRDRLFHRGDLRRRGTGRCERLVVRDEEHLAALAQQRRFADDRLVDVLVDEALPRRFTRCPSEDLRHRERQHDAADVHADRGAARAHAHAMPRPSSPSLAARKRHSRRSGA
jgi:hypothetical protein